MAGDWIKIESVTPDKPEIYIMANSLGIDPDAVMGKMLRIWIWADQQSRDGNALSVTLLAIDRIGCCDGLADAMIDAGWLSCEGDTITFPNFGRHNGQTAKQRGLTYNRQAKHRAKNNDNITQPALSHRDKIVTRDRDRDRDITPIKKKSKKEKIDLKKITLPPPLAADPAFVGIWPDWIDHRLSTKAKITESAAKAQLKKLATVPVSEAVARIERSIMNGYQGLFFPNDGEYYHDNGKTETCTKYRSNEKKSRYQDEIDKRRSEKAAGEFDESHIQPKILTFSSRKSNSNKTT